MRTQELSSVTCLKSHSRFVAELGCQLQSVWWKLTLGSAATFCCLAQCISNQQSRFTGELRNRPVGRAGYIKWKCRALVHKAGKTFFLSPTVSQPFTMFFIGHLMSLPLRHRVTLMGIAGWGREVGGPVSHQTWLTKHKFKDKMIRISRWWPQSMKARARGPSEHGPVHCIGCMSCLISHDRIFFLKWNSKQ